MKMLRNMQVLMNAARVAAYIGVYAAEEAPLTRDVIAKGIGFEKRYAEPFLQRFVKDGILTCKRGPHGGYSLTKTPAEVCIKDIAMSVAKIGNNGFTPAKGFEGVFDDILKVLGYTSLETVAEDIGWRKV